jgi:hypothetical protein
MLPRQISASNHPTKNILNVLKNLTISTPFRISGLTLGLPAGGGMPHIEQVIIVHAATNFAGRTASLVHLLFGGFDNHLSVTRGASQSNSKYFQFPNSPTIWTYLIHYVLLSAELSPPN